MSSENTKLAKAVEARLKAAKYKYRSGNEGRPAAFNKHPGYVGRRGRQ